MAGLTTPHHYCIGGMGMTLKLLHFYSASPSIHLKAVIVESDILHSLRLKYQMLQNENKTNA